MPASSPTILRAFAALLLTCTSRPPATAPDADAGGTAVPPPGVVRAVTLRRAGGGGGEGEEPRAPKRRREEDGALGCEKKEGERKTQQSPAPPACQDCPICMEPLASAPTPRQRARGIAQAAEGEERGEEEEPEETARAGGEEKRKKSGERKTKAAALQAQEAAQWAKFNRFAGALDAEERLEKHARRELKAQLHRVEAGHALEARPQHFEEDLTPREEGGENADEAGPEPDNALTTPCGHTFHGSCLAAWTGRASGGDNTKAARCPMCRAAVPQALRRSPIRPGEHCCSSVTLTVI